MKISHILLSLGFNLILGAVSFAGVADIQQNDFAGDFTHIELLAYKSSLVGDVIRVEGLQVNGGSPGDVVIVESTYIDGVTSKVDTDDWTKGCLEFADSSAKTAGKMIFDIYKKPEVKEEKTSSTASTTTIKGGIIGRCCYPDSCGG